MAKKKMSFTDYKIMICGQTVKGIKPIKFTQEDMKKLEERMKYLSANMTYETSFGKLKN